MDDNKNEENLNNTETISFADAIYEKISSAIGVNNDNQFFCMLIPGIKLNADDYKYDYTSNIPKPLSVEINESQLANKMFDPCQITGFDNGFSLPYQYESALNTLTPKLNKQVIHLKNKLRHLLLSEYPYDFGSGIETKYTLQQVYFKLYDEYIIELNKWSKEQSSKKEELRKKFSRPSEYKEAYIEWYETEAEKHLSIINEKKSKILAIFSPNDMKILEGVLDSGTGAELQEAREALKNARKLTPSNKYIHPVHLIPKNWFEIIGTSFTPSDLMESPENSTFDLRIYSLRRMQLCFYIQNISFLLHDEKKIVDNDFVQFTSNIKQIKEKLDSEDNVIDKILQSWKEKNYIESSQIDSIKKYFSSLTDIQMLLGKHLNCKDLIQLADSPKNKFSLKKIPDNEKELLYKQISQKAIIRKNYIDSIEKIIIKLDTIFNNENFSSYKSILAPAIKQFDTINKKIDLIIEQIKYGIDNHSKESNNLISNTPIPNGFTQITISTNMESLEKQTSCISSNNVPTKGLDFLFSGLNNYTNKYNKQLLKKCTINITMNIAKIGIERDWFNPGLFALTKNMLKLGTAQISPENDNYNGFDKKRLNDMSKCIFPCYPVAFVIARDILINFDFKESDSLSEPFRLIEKQAMSGNGFFMFRNFQGNSTMQQSSSHVHLQNKNIIVKNDSTQLIGYCLEATRADKSDPFDMITKKENEEDYGKQTVKTPNTPPTTMLIKKINSNTNSPMDTIKNQSNESLNKTLSNTKKDSINFSSILDYVESYHSLINQSILKVKQKISE